jgi:hypothetical protein
MKLIVTILLTASTCLFSQASRTQRENVHKLYLEDQSDRGVGDHAALGWQELVKRDAERRHRVREMLASNVLTTGRDFHDAAFIFQHSVQTDSYSISEAANDLLLAHVLASVAISKGDRRSLWISAASLDRYLQYSGKPQIFGTQYSSTNDGPYTQEPYLRSLLPDSLRGVFCVSNLEQQQKNITIYNAGKYPPSMKGCGH